MSNTKQVIWRLRDNKTGAIIYTSNIVYNARPDLTEDDVHELVTVAKYRGELGRVSNTDAGTDGRVGRWQRHVLANGGWKAFTPETVCTTTQDDMKTALDAFIASSNPLFQ
jgi:hypothetical protein